MKASEICIGDWFKAIDYNSPFRITAIYDDVVQTQADYQSEIDGNWYSEAEIKDLVPIELTEEILVKNGFMKDGNGDYEINDGIVIVMDWKGESEHFACAPYEVENYFGQYHYLYVELFECKYVHQLQHLMRLCGIEKELTI